jgi:hypothetical protein
VAKEGQGKGAAAMAISSVTIGFTFCVDNSGAMRRFNIDVRVNFFSRNEEALTGVGWEDGGWNSSTCVNGLGSVDSGCKVLGSRAW